MRDKVLRFFVVDDRYTVDLPSKFEASPSNSERKKINVVFYHFQALSIILKRNHGLRANVSVCEHVMFM